MGTFGKFFTAATIICLPQLGFASNASAVVINGDGDLVVKKTEVSSFTELVANFGSSSEGVVCNNITVVLQNNGSQNVSVYAEKNLNHTLR